MLVLAGCVVPATVPTQRTAVSSSQSAPVSATPSEPVASTLVTPAAAPTPMSTSSSSPPRRAEFHAHGILRAQIERIEGMPIEQAKEELAKLSFDGTIYIQDGAYIEGCKADTVCRIQPGSGFSSHAEIFFVVNAKLQISAPP
jgi:hypothetical protein